MTVVERTVETSRRVWRDRWIASFTSVGTRDTYSDGIDRWFAWCDTHGLDVWDAQPHHVDGYRNMLVDRGAQPATVARHLATVSSFYRHILRRARPGPILTNPAADVDRAHVDTASRRDGLDAAQARAIRAVSIQQGPRSAALVHLLLGTALRVSEAVGASVDGLGWNTDGDCTLAVLRKGGRPDVVVIEAADWAVLGQYLVERREVPDRWLFATTGGRRMSRQTAYRLVRQAAFPVVGELKTIGPHSLRHTAATLALDAGLPVQEVQGMLRHASWATTQRYDRAARERGRGASRKLAEVYRGEHG